MHKIKLFFTVFHSSTRVLAERSCRPQPTDKSLLQSVSIRCTRSPGRCFSEEISLRRLFFLPGPLFNLLFDILLFDLVEGGGGSSAIFLPQQKCWDCTLNKFVLPTSKAQECCLPAERPNLGGLFFNLGGSYSSKSRGIHSRLPICIHGCRPPAEGPRTHPVATAGAQGPRLRGRHPRRSRDGVTRPLPSPPIRGRTSFSSSASTVSLFPFGFPSEAIFSNSAQFPEYPSFRFCNQSAFCIL